MLLTLTEAVWALLHCFNLKSVFMNVFETCSINFALKRIIKLPEQTKSKTAQSCNRTNDKLKFKLQGEKS